MSKRINVNPDHYKTAGRERQGDSLIQDINKQKYGRVRAGKGGARKFPGDLRAARKAQPRKTKRA